MASKKRMFAIDIINDGLFLDLPLSAQALYFHLSMRADDDGFIRVNNRLLEYIGASEADKAALIENGFIIDLNNKALCIISAWNINNRIRKDMYKPSMYKSELAKLATDESGRYIAPLQPRNDTVTNPLQTRHEPVTDTATNTAQERYIDKISIDKISIDKNNIDPKNAPRNDTVTNPLQDRNEEKPNTETEKAEPYNPENDPNTIKGKIKAIREEREKQKRFTPPTLEMVKAYCEERGNGINAEQFLDYYTANGWTQGKGKPIKDWQACVRTWERNGYHGTGGTYNGTNGTPDGETYTNYYPQYAGNDLDKLEPITPADGEKLVVSVKGAKHGRIRD